MSFRIQTCRAASTTCRRKSEILGVDAVVDRDWRCAGVLNRLLRNGGGKPLRCDLSGQSLEYTSTQFTESDTVMRLVEANVPDPIALRPVINCLPPLPPRHLPLREDEQAGFI